RGVFEQLTVNSGRRVLVMYGRAGRNLRTEGRIVVADKLPVLEPDPVAAARAALNLQSLQRSGTQLEWLYGKRSLTRHGADGRSFRHPLEHLLVRSRIRAEVTRPHRGKDIAVIAECSRGSQSA